MVSWPVQGFSSRNSQESSHALNLLIHLAYTDITIRRGAAMIARLSKRFFGHNASSARVLDHDLSAPANTEEIQYCRYFYFF